MLLNGTSYVILVISWLDKFDKQTETIQTRLAQWTGSTRNFKGTLGTGTDKKKSIDRLNLYKTEYLS